MASPTTQVLLTYITRPLVIVVGSIYLLVVGMATWALVHVPVAGRMPAFREITDWGPRFSTARPTDILKESNPEVFIRPQSARVLELMFTSTDERDRDVPSTLLPEHLRRIHELPKVRALQLKALSKGTLSEAILQELGELKQLEAIALVQCDLPDEVWQSLGKLPNLKYLDLSGSSLNGKYSHLESLRHVKTLILGMPASGQVVELDAPLFPELHRLPDIETLAVRDYMRAKTMPERPRPDLPATRAQAWTNPLVSNIVDLRKISTLRRLFVDEFSLAFPGYDLLSQELPGVKVRPDYVNTNRQMQIFIFILLNSIPLFLLATHLQSQFSQPAACLVPGYVPAHVTVAIALWVVVLALNTFLLTLIDISPIVALATNMSMWGVMCSAGAIGAAMQVKPKHMKLILAPFAILTIGIIPLWVPLTLANRSAVDWYLRGNEPVVNYGLILFGFTTAAIILWNSTDVFRLHLERGISSPPLSLDPTAMNAWSQQVYWQNAQSEHRSLADRRLQRILARVDLPGWRQRCNLWIAGNSGSGMIVPAIGAVMLTACFLAVALQLDELAGVSFLLAAGSPMVLMLSAVVPDFGIIALVGFWRSRRPLFAMESLRSTSRLEFSQQVAAAIAWDMGPQAVIYLCVLAWYVWQSNPALWSVSWTLGMFLVFAARWVTVFGLILLSITIRREWVLLLIAVGSGYAMTCVNMLILFLQGRVLNMDHLPPDLPDLGLSGLFAMAAAFCIVAALVAGLGYRRWSRLELA